jgi:hypothetical protein
MKSSIGNPLSRISQEIYEAEREERMILYSLWEIKNNSGGFG